MVVTIGVHNTVESSTILTVFKAKGLHPLTGTGPTFGLYCKYCAYVHKSNLKTVDIFMIFEFGHIEVIQWL